MDLREIGCEDGRWMELAHDCVRWQDLALAVLNLLVLLPESFLRAVRIAILQVPYYIRLSNVPLCWRQLAELTQRHLKQRLSHFSLSLSLSNGATARGGPRPPSRVPSILPGLGRLFSNFCTLALLCLPPLHLPNAAWVSLWGAFLLAH